MDIPTHQIALKASGESLNSNKMKQQPVKPACSQRTAPKLLDPLVASLHTGKFIARSLSLGLNKKRDACTQTWAAWNYGAFYQFFEWREKSR